MKNWYRTFELNEYDILIKKFFNPEHNSYELQCIICDEQVEAKMTLGFPSKQNRDEAFEKMRESDARGLAKTMYNQFN